MAQFNVKDADNYGGELQGYFNLKDDGDSAVVRFLYDSIEDITGYAVHKITVGEKDYFINCIRDNYEDPIDNCPLCANNNYQLAKFYFPLYNITDDEMQVWNRGKQILKTLIPALNEISGNICGTPIKIVRHGGVGDKKTYYTFEVLHNECDNIDLETLLEDIGEPINPIGTMIKDYSYDELKNYVATGKLPDITPENNNNNYVPRGTDNATNNNAAVRRTYTPRNNNNTNAF